eukprot:1157309-Pelagomonas_calceolata.AAC.9
MKTKVGERTGTDTHRMNVCVALGPRASSCKKPVMYIRSSSCIACCTTWGLLLSIATSHEKDTPCAAAHPCNKVKENLEGPIFQIWCKTKIALFIARSPQKACCAQQQMLVRRKC